MIQRLSAVPATRHCLDLANLDRLSRAPDALAPALRQARRASDQALHAAFRAQIDIRELVQARAWVIEQLVLLAWERYITEDAALELVAVGGFGRGELHPHSDVDLLILLPEDQSADRHQGEIEQFVQALWDAELQPGHSVRTLEDCLRESAQDVTVATNLMDARLMAGHGRLYSALTKALQTPSIWPADAFFSAKLEEQNTRHKQHADTIYNLEPNLKEGPGGLRDFQTIAWVTHRHFGTSTLHGLVEHGFLSEREHEALVASRDFLWNVRWALHETAGRAEERLLFEHQRRLAEWFGFGNTQDSNEPVERFMQRYYRSVMQMASLNERLLQSFDEELLAGREHLPSFDLDEHFRVRDGYLELKDPHALVVKPELIMRLFLVLCENPETRGVRASTIRLITEHLYLIDEDYRTDPRNLGMFLDVLRSPRLVYSQLARMNRYGVLGALLPAFGEITGRMQFDLFHVYTVDQHTLFLIRNLRRFTYGRDPEQFAQAIEVCERIERPEILYLAAIFHDIAKGRGGDHSELGAVDAREFVDRLPISDEDRDLVVWLVADHLIMSRTSQREDISDPAVVERFVEHVQTQRKLDHLFVLTVADIAATSPKLWNSWKGTLLWELYKSASQALKRGPEASFDRQDSVDETRAHALDTLEAHGQSRSAVESLWSRLPESAFLRLDADQMAWTTTLALRSQRLPLVATRQLPDKGITELFVHAEDFIGLFAGVARELDRMQLSVLAARVVTTEDSRSWDLFQLMSGDSQLLNRDDADRLCRSLVDQLAAKAIRPLPARPVPRRLQPFMGRSEITIDSRDGRTRLEIAATDRPGLLSAIAQVLAVQNMQLLDARIATFGQRIEDVFQITDAQGDALTSDARASLETELRRRLDVG